MGETFYFKERKKIVHFAKLYDENDSSFREILKRVRESLADLTVAPQIAKFTVMVCDEYLDVMAKVLNLCICKAKGHIVGLVTIHGLRCMN